MMYLMYRAYGIVTEQAGLKDLRCMVMCSGRRMQNSVGAGLAKEK
jgi:hypothetical protein